MFPSLGGLTTLATGRGNTYTGTYAPTPAPAPNDVQSSGNTLGLSTTTPVLAPAVNQNQPLIDLIQGALSRLPGELQTATSNIQHQFDTNNNELQSSYDAANQQYGQQTTQNQQQYRLNKNQIADNASAGLSSLLRLLGAHGAGGSSDAQYVAPQAVAQVASQQRAGAGQNYGQNQQGLDTNWNTFTTGFNNSKKQLNDWLQGQLQSVQSQSAQTEQGLQQQLLGLQPSVAAAQPYVQRINDLAGQVDSLAKLNPTYDGKSPAYTAPSISSYTVNPNAPIQQNQSALDSATTPFLSLLLGNQKDKNQLQPQF